MLFGSFSTRQQCFADDEADRWIAVVGRDIEQPVLDHIHLFPAGSRSTAPESSTPRNTAPPSAFANATSSPASSWVLGASTPRSPKRTSLNSERPVFASSELVQNLISSIEGQPTRLVGCLIRCRTASPSPSRAAFHACLSREALTASMALQCRSPTDLAGVL